jgi:hypothetical protein
MNFHIYASPELFPKVKNRLHFIISSFGFLECVAKMPEAQFRRLCLHFGVDFP